MKISWKYIRVFLTKRGIDSGLLYFLYLWCFFLEVYLLLQVEESAYWYLQVILSMFSLFYDLFSYLPKKSRVAVTAYPAWAVVLHPDWTLESPGRFQSPFAWAIPIPIKSEIVRAPHVILRLNTAGTENACLMGKSCRIHRAQGLLARLFQCLKLGHNQRVFFSPPDPVISVIALMWFARAHMRSIVRKGCRCSLGLETLTWTINVIESKQTHKSPKVYDGFPSFFF